MKDQARGSSANANATEAPTTSTVTIDAGESLPLEFMGLPESALDEPQPILDGCFVCETPKLGQYTYRGKILGESRRVNTDSFGYLGLNVKERLKLRLLRSETRPETMPIERDESQVGASRKIPASMRDTMDQNAQVRNQVRSTCPQVQLSSKNSAGSVSTEPICFATLMLLLCLIWEHA